MRAIWPSGHRNLAKSAKIRTFEGSRLSCPKIDPHRCGFRPSFLGNLEVSRGTTVDIQKGGTWNLETGLVPFFASPAQGRCKGGARAIFEERRSSRGISSTSACAANRHDSDERSAKS